MYESHSSLKSAWGFVDNLIAELCGCTTSLPLLAAPLHYLTCTVSTLFPRHHLAQFTTVPDLRFATDITQVTLIG